MPFTAYIDQALVTIRDYRGEWKGRLTCPECGDKMHHVSLTLDPFRVAFYRHNPSGTPGARSCSFADETPEHRQAKQTLLAEGMRFFQRGAGELEYSFEVNGRKRRADVYLPQQDRQYPVALEAQYSPIDFAGEDGRSIEERTRDYHAAGMYIIWCIPPKRGSDKLKEALKRVYGCYGELSSDGETVQFIGTNALFLNQHPMRWMQSRREYIEKRETTRRNEAERIDRERAAAIAARNAREQAEVEEHTQWMRKQQPTTEDREYIDRGGKLPVNIYRKPDPMPVLRKAADHLVYVPQTDTGRLRDKLMAFLGWPRETYTMDELKAYARERGYDD
jgi:hypothetical protein